MFLSPSFDQSWHAIICYVQNLLGASRVVARVYFSTKSRSNFSEAADVVSETTKCVKFILIQGDQNCRSNQFFMLRDICRKQIMSIFYRNRTCSPLVSA